MIVYITDVNLPLDREDVWLISDEIERSLGPCDTGAGFGWRDLEIQSESESAQQHVVAVLRGMFARYGLPFTEGYENRRERTACINTRSVDPEEDAHDEEMSITHGLIPPGYEE